MEQNQNSKKNSFSHLAAYSIAVFALALFAAVLLDIFFPFKFFPEPTNRYIGIVIIIVSTFVLYWAELHGHRFSHKRKKGEVTDSSHLCNGPYCYSRNPKYIGLGLLLIGLGFVLNSIFVTLAAIVSILVVNFFMVKREESFMTERHGDVYHGYKKKVKKWL